MLSAATAPRCLHLAAAGDLSPAKAPSIVRISQVRGLKSPEPPRKLRQTLTSISCSSSSVEGQIAVGDPSLELPAAADVVREFYDGINRRDLPAVEPLIAEGCVYEDLVFSKPFVGRKAILEFFHNFTESISADLQFAIDDISNEDSSAVGVTWHLEWQGRPFPFSKGCSFYRLEVLDGKRRIVYGRDCVEPATKPGEFALVIIRGVTWLLQQFPRLADRL